MRNCIHGLRKNNIIVNMPTRDVLLRHLILQNVINGTYTRLHTLISYVLLAAPMHVLTSRLVPLADSGLCTKGLCHYAYASVSCGLDFTGSAE